MCRLYLHGGPWQLAASSDTSGLWAKRTIDARSLGSSDKLQHRIAVACKLANNVLRCSKASAGPAFLQRVPETGHFSQAANK